MLRSKVEAKSSSYMANQQANAQLDPNQLKADVDKLARRMKAMNRGLIDLNGKFIQYWDFFTISALLFTRSATAASRPPAAATPARAAAGPSTRR